MILVGMWLERFIIIVTSLHRDFLPSSWGHYVPTRWDYAVLSGTFGFFCHGDVYLHSHHARRFRSSKCARCCLSAEVKAK